MDTKFDIKGAKKAMKALDTLIDFYDCTWGGGDLQTRDRLIKELIPLKNDLYTKIKQSEES